MMNHKLIGMTLAAAALACGLVTAQTAKSVPGLTGKDPYPNGCVSCHVKSAGRDTRLNVDLKKIKGHPNVAGIVKTAPTDCAKCHAANSPNAISIVLHRAHFGKMGKSVFVQKFGGNCLSCHSFDPKTSRMKVKSGPKNW